MGNRMGSTAEEYKDVYPSMPIYLKCQSSAFVSGMIALLLAASGTFIAQDLVAKSLPWKRKAFIFPSVMIGSVVSYKVTRWRTRECQDMWIAMEGKYTYLESVEVEREDYRQRPSLEEGTDIQR